jgi:hypothetical protein
MVPVVLIFYRLRHPLKVHSLVIHVDEKVLELIGFEQTPLNLFKRLGLCVDLNALQVDFFKHRFLGKIHK